MAKKINMKVSKKARKQRLSIMTAPQHKRRKMMSARLAPEYLNKKGKWYPRAVPVRKGDTVVVLRGNKDIKGQEGKVASVDYGAMRITIEGLTQAKADKSMVARKIHPSNVMITKLDESDPWRRRKLEELANRGRDAVIGGKDESEEQDEDIEEPDNDENEELDNDEIDDDKIDDDIAGKPTIIEDKPSGNDEKTGNKGNKKEDAGEVKNV